MGRLGVMYDRGLPPEGLASWARGLEGRGVDELWVVEDLGWAGGVSSAAVALAATERVTVGIGITPAPLRNPVLLAMELATLARAYRGRLIAGIGHGVFDWMEAVGALPTSQLALLEETIAVTRSLLRGEEVSLDGREIRIRGARLVHPPEVPPPVIAGVVKKRSLRLSGRVADGTLMIESSGPDDLRTARAEIDAGRAEAGAAAPEAHELVVYAHAFVDEDPERVREATAGLIDEYARFRGIDPGGVYLPRGAPAAFAGAVEGLWDAGAASVVLHPLGPDFETQTTRALAALGR
jgi:alkanesulfonate monooxygenase SsuD/methylene tetrahydromethanopterin reductase-like flavin-dependent oxidoreductase (luciferase family)